jgi:hypothetical protein
MNIWPSVVIITVCLTDGDYPVLLRGPPLTMWR